jgi:hypothetical protein
VALSRFHHWPGFLLLAATLGYGIHLFLSERSHRLALGPVTAFAPVAAISEIPATSSPGALLTVLGFQGETAAVKKQEVAILRGIVVATSEESRALMTVAGNQRTYRVGERLPGGSVLRRIEASRVFLWRNGHEVVLPLVAPAATTLRTARAITTPTSSYLRPAAASSQEQP